MPYYDTDNNIKVAELSIVLSDRIHNSVRSTDDVVTDQCGNGNYLNIMRIFILIFKFLSNIVSFF